jgi:hypothetical protein
MARRRRGFTVDQRRDYNRLKKTGLKDYEIAQEWGISRSYFSRVKNKGGRFGETVKNRIDLALSGGSDLFSIDFTELERLAGSNNPFVAKQAEKAIDQIDDQNPDLSIEELRNKSFKRPSYTRQIGGKKVTILLGRSKQEEQRDAVRKQLRDQGVNPDDIAEYYDEALMRSAGGARSE